MAITLREVVKKVQDLPALPQITTRVLELINDPDSTPEDVGNLINQDQSLTAKVLRLANSAYYGFPRRISTVTEATILLGFNTVRSLVMAASVSSLMGGELKGYALDAGELWRHSMAAAMAARLLALKSGQRRLADQAFVGGLLHDIGKVILDHYTGEAYREIVTLTGKEKIPFMDAETRVLGFNHATVGGLVIDRWNLPPQLVDAVKHHHSPGRAEHDRTLVCLVHLADAVCLMMGMSLGSDGLLYPVDVDALGTLGIGQREIEETISQLSDSFLDDNPFLQGNQ